MINKKMVLKIILFLFSAMTIAGLGFKIDINAFSSNLEQEELQLVIEETKKSFNDLEIKNIIYLYNLNDSPDYVLVDFINSGYVIYYRDTLEIMEYSYLKNLEYSNDKSRKYYAGPFNYYEKKNNRFVDLDTGYSLNLSDSDIEIFTNSLTSMFSKNKNERLDCIVNVGKEVKHNYTGEPKHSNDPPIDTTNLIPASSPGSPNVTYIDNYAYFLANPKHGYNEHGTCGSVASQLLLGYNNYYNDRRIIDVEHLYGDWTGLVSSDLYDSANYSYPNKNMNVCDNPTSLTSFTTGTNDNFYEYVIQNIEPSAFNCICTTTIIEILDGIATITVTIEYPDGTTSTSISTRDAYPGETNSINTEHTHNGSSINNIVNGLKNILDENFNTNQYNITYDSRWWVFGWSPISSTPIKNEINSGRPLIIGMDSHLGGRDHWVLGYGYQDYTYPGTSDTYSGYIVNYGWTNKYNVWINESWCNAYISLQMNHVHDYNIVTNNIIDNCKIELRCSECGYRKLDDLYTMSNNKIVDVNYSISGDIEIPESIDGTPILSIGSNSFAGLTNISSVTIPNSIEIIESNAFIYCSSLEDVTILRWQTPITTLGLYAFSNCASNLTITVPTNRVCEYKNTPFWSSYRDKIVPSSPIIDDIDLDCMVDDDVTTYLNAGYNKLYRLDVECDGWYTISCTSGTHYSIYNSNMVKIAGAYDNYELTLNEGTYYIDIEWEDPTDSGYATLHFLNKGINVSDNITNNILPHLHNVGTNYKAQLKYYHTQGAGYYKFTLTATSSNSNPVEYILGAITMYTAFDRNGAMNKYSDDKYTLSAESLAGENSMVVYLPSNGYYYFDVKMNTNSLSSLVLNITPYISSDIDLFDCSVSSNHDIDIINTNVKGDYFQKKVLKQKGKFIISFAYTDPDPDPNNISSSDVVVVVTKVTYNANTNTYSFAKVYSVDFCEADLLFTSYIITNSLDLDAGTYYIGYFNNTDCANIKVDFERKITQYGSYNLISDPNSSEEYGSEVRFNNGSYLGSTLTVGFTRFIYLNYDYILPSYSRLDYYFYSSNDSIASISEYGTLLGKSAGTVKIMAVYKSDPSITFVKQFTILADNRVNNLIIYDTDSITYTSSGQLYQIELDDYNSYFPQISLYNWTLISSSNNYTYSISEWGTFSLYGADIIIIEGTSKLNSKIKIRLTLTVTN